jgi:hypothetical protein
MALLHELTDYRKVIMKLLCSDQKIVDLINDKSDSQVPDRSLMYSRIFPYAYTPDTTKETDTYVCFRIYVPEVFNKTFKKMNIVFYIFSHQSHIRTSDGLRPDLIAERIENLFNGSMDLGVGRMKLEGMDDISPATNFHGIALEYTVSEFNRPTINGDPRAGAK